MGVFFFSLFGGISDLGAIGNGLLLAVCIFKTGPISGGHLNPAVSLAMAITQQVPVLKALLFMVSQIFGASLGALCTGLLTRTNVVLAHNGSIVGPGCFTPGEGETAATVFTWELLATFFLVNIIFSVAIDQRGFSPLAPIAIGLTLLTSAAAIGKYTGGSLNPARTIGAFVAFGCPRHGMVIAYLGGEFAGALLGAVFYKYSLLPRERYVGQQLISTYIVCDDEECAIVSVPPPRNRPPSQGRRSSQEATRKGNEVKTSGSGAKYEQSLEEEINV